MVHYKPISEVHGEYIDGHALFGYKAQIFAVIGAKGYGKTFLAKKYALKRAIYRGEGFALLRDTDAACDAICENNGLKFVADIIARNKAIGKHSIKIAGRNIILDDQPIGQVMPLSLFYKYKGNSFPYKTVIFDEFIKEKTQVRRGSPAYQFVITVDTIARDNPNTRFILTANALDSGDDILELLGANIKPGRFGYYYNPDKRAVVYYAPNSPEFEARRQNSLAFRLAKGTSFEGEIAENKFNEDTPVIFEAREPCHLYGIYYSPNGIPFRVFQSESGAKWYVTKDINPASYGYMRYVFEVGKVSLKKKLAPPGTLKMLTLLHSARKIEFESKYILDEFLSTLDIGGKRYVN